MRHWYDKLINKSSMKWKYCQDSPDKESNAAYDSDKFAATVKRLGKMLLTMTSTQKLFLPISQNVEHVKR